MAGKYLRITEVIKICGVDEKFILRLEQENVIYPIIRRRQKLYPFRSGRSCACGAPPHRRDGSEPRGGPRWPSPSANR